MEYMEKALQRVPVSRIEDSHVYVISDRQIYNIGTVGKC